MRTRGFTGVDKLQVRRRGRAVATVTAALVLMLAVVVSSPRQPVATHDTASVGIAHEVTDTVSTDSAPSHQSDGDAPTQVIIVIGAVAMLTVVGLAFSRRKPHGSDRL
jgi:NADH:ubiquinone oxidoreductase subunit 6 (subunit J)